MGDIMAHVLATVVVRSFQFSCFQKWIFRFADGLEEFDHAKEVVQSLSAEYKEAEKEDYIKWGSAPPSYISFKYSSLFFFDIRFEFNDQNTIF